ncbi:MAG: hypothetical protein HYY49_12515 [Ignavibacteriales bacterium]|nr:hypothetical protein [Ignavibacteriales bacterium]
MNSLITFSKFLGLVVALNIIRYTVPMPYELPLAVTPMMEAMSSSASYFNTHFTNVDWITSYFYNFMMWLSFSWLYFYIHGMFKGNHVTKSLKLYAIMLVVFAAISAIYMNHYSHPKDFYIWSIVDAALVFPVVAIGNGLLFPLMFKKELGAATASPAEKTTV